MSSELAIQAVGLGKEYSIGPRERYQSLRDVITDAARAPFSRRSGKAHQTIWALRDASFDLMRGEVLGVIGRNGAGKSTLLKLLSRITEPTEGFADIRGRVGALLEVGTGFHPELTGRENIFLNGAILGMTRAEIVRKFDEIVAFANVEKFIDTPVKHYSSGMRVRLAFAVAAHLEPEILVVDEVLAVGDHEFQKKCLGKMGEVGRSGRTVLLVSHNMPSVLNLCTRAILLDGGRIVASGNPSEIVKTYLSSVKSAEGEVIWDNPETAPGNDVVRLSSVSIRQPDDPTFTADVDISKDVLVEVTYWNLCDGARLYPAIWLKDQLGTFVLSSSNHRSISFGKDPWDDRPHPVGLYRSVCRIPGNFLNEGMYSIAAIVGRGVSDTQVLEDFVISFTVHDTGEMRQEYLGGWVGPVVRPRLEWVTERLEGDPTVEAPL